MSDTTTTQNFPEPWQPIIRYEDHENRGQELVTALREFADHLEAHPVIANKIAPWKLYDFGNTCWNMFAYGDEDFPEESLPALRRTAGLTEKFMTDNKVGFFKDFGGIIRLVVCQSRDAVCAQIETDEDETYEEVVVVTPAVAAVVETVTKVRKKKVWDCSPLLAAGSDD